MTSRRDTLKKALWAQGLEASPKADLHTLETLCAAHKAYPPGLVLVQLGRVIAGPFPNMLALSRSMAQRRGTIVVMEQDSAGLLTFP